MASRYGSIRIVEQGTTSGRKLESENIDAYDRLINKKKFLDFISPLAGHLKMIKTGGRNNRGCYGNMCCTRARHFYCSGKTFHFTVKGRNVLPGPCSGDGVPRECSRLNSRPRPNSLLLGALLVGGTSYRQRHKYGGVNVILRRYCRGMASSFCLPSHDCLLVFPCHTIISDDLVLPL